MNDMREPTPKILIADDVESIVLLMKKILTKDGYDIETAKDGEECLNKIQTYKPDLVILDIMMPKIHGFDVLKKVLTGECPPGIIICTSKSYKPDIDQAIALGAFDVIVKPFEQEEFRKKIRQFFLGLKRTTQSRTGITVQPSGEVPYNPALDLSRAYFCLWGTRGSVPVSGKKYIHHGGNTSCMSVHWGDETVIIDAGTGIRDLGMVLVSQKPRRIHVFISHTHWDHIQGFPFFVPAYIPGAEITIYGASGFGKDLRSLFSGQLDRDYFPVQLEDINAQIEFKHLSANPVSINGMKIFWDFTNHPGATLGFKIVLPGVTIGYLSDNEFLKGYLGSPAGLARDNELLRPYSQIIDFISGVGILVGEAQYTNEEYAKKIGWGHSSLSNACLLAKLANIPRWIVTHHDPVHDDEFLMNKLNLMRQVLMELDHRITICNGFDGLIEYI